MDTVKTSKNRSSKKTKRIIIIISAVLIVAIAAAVIALPFLAVGAVWGGLNLLKPVIYPEYYSIKSDLCTNPGLSDGFVCQGICAYEGEKEDKIFVSGYMKDGSNSRIYVTDLNNNSYYVNLLTPEGEDFIGHAGGIAIQGEMVFVADDSALWLFPIEHLLDAENGDFIRFSRTLPVNNAASFVFGFDEYILVGEFHDGENYITDNYYKTPNGDENHAIVSIYDDLDVYKGDGKELLPEGIISIPDKVQGICSTPDGKLIMSTSYGLADSVYYIFKPVGSVCIVNYNSVIG